MSKVSVLTSAASLAKSVIAEAALLSDSASLASFCCLSLGRLVSSPSKTSKTAEDSSEAGGKTARTLWADSNCPILLQQPRDQYDTFRKPLYVKTHLAPFFPIKNLWTAKSISTGLT